MKKTTLALAIAAMFATSPVFADRNYNNDNDFIDVDINLNSGQQIILNDDVAGDFDVVVLNEQRNSASVHAEVETESSNSIIGNGVGGNVSGSFNSLGVSATAVGNNASVNVAGKYSSSTSHSFGLAKNTVQMNNNSYDVLVANQQGNSGNITAEVETDGNTSAIGNVVAGNISGDFNGLSVSSTAVANSVSVNVGGVVQ